MQACGRGVLVALALVLFSPAFCAADLAAKPDAYTEHDRLREKLEYLRKTLVDAYKQVGNRNPAWDAEAVKFLEAAAQHFGSAGFGPQYGVEAPQWPELIKLGEAAVKKGCDDPLVLYCYSAFLIDSDRADEGKPILQQAYKALLAGKYSTDRVYYAAHRMLKLAENARDRLEINAELDKARLQMLSMPFVNSAHRREVAHWLWAEFPRTPAKRQAFFDQAMKDPRTDKWIVNLFGGRHYVKAAWDARGGDWAANVKREGWLGFEANLEKARECLTVAWKLAPNLPEAPAEMITVAMGQSGKNEKELRTWFDRAVDAQFDYRDAYHKLRWALYPRWLGSHEEMLALGIECYRTGRYDTGVPYELIKSLEAIRDDRGGDLSLWDKPEMYDMIKDVMVNYAQKLKDKPEWRNWYLSYAAALANRNNKHDESRKFLEQIDDKIDEKTYTNLRLNPKLSVSESYLLTGPFAERFKKAEDLQKTDKHEQAAAEFQKLIDELPKNDKGLVIARGLLQRSEDVVKLASGEWVDLSPRIDLDPWGSGYFGAWSSPKEGELLGVADQRGLMAMPGLAMPPRYEFSAECEIRRDGEIQSPNAGLVVNFAGWQTSYPGVWVYPAEKKMFTRGTEDKWHDNIECGDKFKLTVRVIDDNATVILDGKEVAKFSGVSRANARRTGIGLTGMYQLPEAEVVYREIKVRKIKKDDAGEEK